MCKEDISDISTALNLWLHFMRIIHLLLLQKSSIRCLGTLPTQQPPRLLLSGATVASLLFQSFRSSASQRKCFFGCKNVSLTCFVTHRWLKHIHTTHFYQKSVSTIFSVPKDLGFLLRAMLSSTTSLLESRLTLWSVVALMKQLPQLDDWCTSAHPGNFNMTGVTWHRTECNRTRRWQSEASRWFLKYSVHDLSEGRDKTVGSGCMA